MALVLSSSAFNDKERIPRKYTGDGADISPPLKWEGVPDNTKGIVLICDDPDAPAGTWDHWILYDITPEGTNLEEGIPSGEVVAGVGKQGRNDFGNLGYGGPAPPRGKPHRYFFRLYAIDAPTGLEPGATKDEVLSAIEDHTLAKAELVGLYGR